MNSFENLYGYLFRNYAKAIIDDVCSNAELINPDKLTIGVLQYHPIDNSFYYTPTLKNVLKYPREITTDEFPTKRDALWNFKLMFYLAKYISEHSQVIWVNELIAENEELARAKGSIYNVTFEDYTYFRKSWCDWFNENIKLFKSISEDDLSSFEVKNLLNRLFYFANYLMTIIRRPAFINKLGKKKSNAESTFLCINNPNIFDNIDNIFSKETGEIRNGLNIPWRAEPNLKEFKAQLIFILEVCFKQPLSVVDKIAIIKNAINNNFDHIKTFKINAMSVPLISCGEFLGISYLAWVNNDKDLSFEEYEKIQKAIRKSVQDNRLSSFLYKARFETARFYLQNITGDQSLEKSPIKRLFQTSHLYSSAHLVAFIDFEDKLIFRFQYKDAHQYKTTELVSKKSGSELTSFLSKELKNFPLNAIEKATVEWIDVFDTLIPVNNPEKIQREVFNEIEEFNNKLLFFINESELNYNDYFKITNINIFSFFEDGKIDRLLFFNSNFRHLYNQTIVKNNTKQSYAREFYNNLSILIEDEKVHRKLYIQEREVRTEMDRDLFHFIKSQLETCHNYYLNISNYTAERKIELIKEQDKILIEKVKSYLKIYDVGSSENLTSMREIVLIWNEMVKNFSDNNLVEISPLAYNDCVTNKLYGCINSISLIFSLFIQNAIKEAITNEVKIKLELSLINLDNYLEINIWNYNSIISPKYRHLIGKSIFGSSFGFKNMQRLLKRMKAYEFKNGLNFEIEYYDDKTKFNYKFKLKNK